jgi:secreted Zn-dependent insulinase-like peptidase
MNAIFKDPAFSDVRDAYLKETKLTMPAIINKVYREPLANRFLASTSTFIHQHLDFEPLRQMVVDNFRLFFQRNVQQYQRHDLSIHAIGSIAHYFQEELAEAACKENFALGTILRTPMEGLISYHQKEGKNC